MKVKFSCVADKHSRFGRQAFVWAASLLTYGGAETDSLVIHTVGDYTGKFGRTFDDWGIETHAVTAFDLRHPPSNKLAQLESAALHAADYVVLCDCDLAFFGNIFPWICGSSIRARVASHAGLPWARWEKLFEAAGLTLPSRSITPLLKGEKTLPTYCNGGLYILPQAKLQALREVWPRWDRWILDHEDLIRPFQAYADQVSFAMSCVELETSIDYLPLELNLPGVVRLRTKRRIVPRNEIHPIVLHYHQMNARGFLRLTKMPSVNRQIRKINDLIRFAENVNYDKSSVLLLRKAGLHA
jgi:hypothetical protein